MDESTLLWLKSEFGSVQRQLGSIKEQTDKTETKVNDIEKSLYLIGISEAHYYLNCPYKEKIEAIEKSNLHFQFFVDHSKAFLTYGTVMVLGTVLSLAGLFYGYYTDNKKIDINTKGREVNATAIQNIEGEKTLGPQYKKLNP